MQSVSYERKQQMWVGQAEEGINLDVCLYCLPIQMYIENNHITIQNAEDIEVKWNEEVSKETKIILKEGDTIAFPDIFFTFFKERIEIQGEQQAYSTTLLPVRGEEEHFQGFPFYKRSPRVIYRTKEECIEVKAPPQKKEFSKGSMAQMIIPPLCMLAFTIAMGVFMKRGPYVYMTAGMTVITLVFSIQRFISERKEMKAGNKKRIQVYDDYLLGIRQKIRRLREEEKQALEYQNPTIHEISDMVNAYSSRIYERNGLEDDFLTVNLGYYKGSSGITVEFKEKELDVNKDDLIEEAKDIVKEYGKIEHIPVSVDLKRAHLGLVGSKENVHEQLKYLMAQLTFFQSYHDLQVVFIHNGDYDERFAYTRWYPHLRIKAINVIGEISSEQARDQILGSIQQMLKDRKLKLEEEKQDAIFSPHLLFVIDEPKLILNHAIMEYLQKKEMNLGFSIIYTTDQKANLPENIQTVCLLHNSKDGVLLLNEGERKNRSFGIEHVNTVDLEQTARSLNALIHEQGVSSKIPESITFFDMYQVEHPEDLQIKERWRKNESHKSLAVPLGVRAEEDYVDLNLHEKAHGPHGLVAGTTGSGKSEIVQSYILSLAVNFHPHEVGFLLIDYKGGGMANLFANLPHLLGTITNLDKAESMRAMASIKSELSRRQRIFGEHNVNHINGYNKLFKLGKVEEPLPHLFLISDEFAELKKEQPEFMSELVSAARIGRSLGIHLILATQKPSGVVDDQIWTNSKFKLCLKVQNAGDSKEMLHTPDAANITQAGRAYLQVGNNEIYELFQSAWSGATYDAELAEEEKEDDRVYLLNSLGQGELINQDLSGGVESNQIKETQLDVVVNHIRELYDVEHPVEVKKPWLPSLPTQLVSPYTREVKDSAAFTKLDLTLGLGLVDIPEEQKQEEYMLDFVKNGHLLYMASSGYGKSMLLGHIILGLSMKNSVEQFNCYILDWGNSALIPFKGLPHVADYMGFDDAEKVEKFQKLILEEMAERKKKLAKAMTQNFNVYNQSQEETLKGIVIALDNYDVIQELGDSMVAFIQKVARDGTSLGIFLAVTLTRENVMRGATKGSFKEHIAGFNFTEGENTSFIGRSQISLPEDKKGRALVKLEHISLMQLYTSAMCEDELSYNAKLKETISQVAHVSTEKRAKNIPTLPENLYYSMLSQYPGYIEELTKLPVGLDVNTLEIQYLDTKREAGIVIGGGETGRTNLLQNVLHHIGRTKTYLFDAKNGTLRNYEKQEYIHYAGDKANAEILIESIHKEAEQRKQQYENEKTYEMTLREFGKECEPVFILVDVIQELYDLLDGKDEVIDVLFEAVQCGMNVIVTSDTKLRARGSQFLNMLVESKCGVVLGNIKEQSIFSYTGLREENRKIDIGYYNQRGENKKMKLIEHNE